MSLVTAFSDNDLWVVGGTVSGNGGVEPVALHWLNGQWVNTAQPSGEDYLENIVPDGSGGLWASFEGPYAGAGTVVHYTSGAWSTVTLPEVPDKDTSATLLDQVPDSGTVYAAGMSFWGGEPQTAGLILKY